jgi:hypothetical protein
VAAQGKYGVAECDEAARHAHTDVTGTGNEHGGMHGCLACC